MRLLPAQIRRGRPHARPSASAEVARTLVPRYAADRCTAARVPDARVSGAMVPGALIPGMSVRLRQRCTQVLSGSQKPRVRP